MGVTCIQFSTLESKPYLVAVGSYDEHIRMWDSRAMGSPIYSGSSGGGGIWRLKWGNPNEPKYNQMMVAACMHAGFQLWDVSKGELLHLETYTEPHTSLAYGVDWIVREGTPLVACCSFYDHLFSLWEPKICQ